MIEVDFPDGPFELGETRILRISGDGPFRVHIHCFLSAPSLGLQPYDKEDVLTVSKNDPVNITADAKYWTGRAGGFQIDISDSTGGRRRIHANVRAISSRLSAGIVRA